MNRDLSRFGELALITGASSGIGEAFARGLAEAGMNVALVARRKQRLEALAEELRTRHGVDAYVFDIDLAREGAGAALQQRISETGLQVDLLVNNAGFGQYGPVTSTDLDRQLAMIDLNCRAVVDLSHRFGEGMKQRRRGGIIILSSVLGEMPAPHLNVYAATKGFDLYFGLALYHEMKPYGVAVLTVEPGPTSTEFGEVAGFELAGWNPLQRTAQQVVNSSLHALGRKPAVVDGLGNKAVVQLMRWLPRRLAVPLTGRVIRNHHGGGS